MKKVNGMINGTKEVFATGKTYSKIFTTLQKMFGLSKNYFNTHWSKGVLGNIGEQILAASEKKEGVWVCENENYKRYELI